MPKLTLQKRTHVIGFQAAAVLLIRKQHVAARVQRSAQRERGAIGAVVALQ